MPALGGLSACFLIPCLFFSEIKIVLRYIKALLHTYCSPLKKVLFLLAWSDCYNAKEAVSMVISKQITSGDDEEAPYSETQSAETSIVSDEATMSLQNQSGLTIGLKLSPRGW